uniref:Transmembrane protein n=1 Tax=Medicago truncatula TaxID=3880 RepID=I3T264_MEDTR|nr:unknown [Medicago truncatula]
MLARLMSLLKLLCILFQDGRAYPGRVMEAWLLLVLRPCQDSQHLYSILSYFPRFHLLNRLRAS